MKRGSKIRENQRKGLEFERQQLRAERILHLGADVTKRKTGRDADIEWVGGLSGQKQVRHIEVKKGKTAKLSKKQKEFRERVLREGRRYDVIRG